MDRKKLEKKYPHLSKEVEGKKSTVPIKGVRITEEKEIPGKKKTTPPEDTSLEYAPGRIFSGYDPGPIDFIRRCRTKEEAMEIKGLDSFGAKKEWGHYEKTTRTHRP
ncbi:MAG: DUF2095 family protein [Candidatus Ranarchaeia archaeon]|jgi:hypothetical protein